MVIRIKGTRKYLDMKSILLYHFLQLNEFPFLFPSTNLLFPSQGGFFSKVNDVVFFFPFCSIRFSLIWVLHEIKSWPNTTLEPKDGLDICFLSYCKWLIDRIKGPLLVDLVVVPAVYWLTPLRLWMKQTLFKKGKGEG